MFFVFSVVLLVLCWVLLCISVCVLKILTLWVCLCPKPIIKGAKIQKNKLMKMFSVFVVFEFSVVLLVLCWVLLCISVFWLQHDYILDCL